MRHFIIISLALVFVLLTAVEHISYRAWDGAQTRHMEIQSKIVAVQFQNFRIDQLLRRIAHDAKSDPGLLEGLGQSGIVFQIADQKQAYEQSDKSVSPLQTPLAPGKPMPKIQPDHGNKNTE